jgi:hypothetical protein
MESRPYWEIEEGWNNDGNCKKCGEAGRCICPHPLQTNIKLIEEEFKNHIIRKRSRRWKIK